MSSQSMPYEPTNYAQECRVLQLTDQAPMAYAMRVSRHEIRSSFHKWPMDPSPTSSDSEGTRSAMRLSDFKPPQPSVVMASTFISSFMSSHLGPNTVDKAFAIVGGVARKEYGVGSPYTFDVDVAFRGNVSDLFDAMSKIKRFSLPSTKQTDHALTVFIKVGPAFGQNFLGQNNLIRCDILINGLVAAQFWNQAKTVNLRLTPQNETAVPVQILNVVWLFKCKAKSYSDRQKRTDWDDAAAIIRKFAPTLNAFKTLGDPIDNEFLIQNPPRNEHPDAWWNQVLTLPSR